MTSLSALLARWRAEPSIGGNFTAWETLPAREARFTPLPDDLHPALSAALQQSGIKALYRHQQEAILAIRNSAHTAIATGTASGKTLCYNLPALDRLLREPRATALYIFPTKALARDQSAALEALLSATSSNWPASSGETQLPPIGIYDGDTLSARRPAIRKKARILLTNPDMLHAGILPHHTRWERFLRGLRFVIVDEMHTYRGVFGSHVANVLRRLKRIAAFYGQETQFILTSATIGNPHELARQLIEAPVTLIDEDTSTRGARHFLIYNPPLVDEALGIRAGVLSETLRLLEDLSAYNLQTIIFGRTRRSVELMLRAASQTTTQAKRAKGIDNPIYAAYRSGYLPRQRREIERGLREGRIRAVISTSALELGIDIGQMEAALLAGYPGSIASAWQQAGRAGRGKTASLAVLIASASPLDQFLARHPDYFFARSPEQARLDPDNPLILLAHLRAAAFELPFEDGDSFGGVGWRDLSEFLEYLRETGSLLKSGRRFFWGGGDFPAAEISLRSASPRRVVLQSIENGKPATIGEVDFESAPWMVHPEAIYLHQGDMFFVDDLDLEAGTARLRPVDVDFFTRPQRETEIQLLELEEAAETRGGFKTRGEIRVATQVTGYRKIHWSTRETLGYGQVDLPPSELLTTGYWLSLSEETVAALASEGAWRNKRNNYGSNWPQVRAAVRERDGYRCQFCGAPEGERAHHVHHLQPFRTFESAEAANRPENLVTLCPTCHQRAEHTVRVRSGLAGLAFVLEHLAPLFLMCDRGDLGVHADPKSPLADGRPAVTLYDGVPGGIGFSARLFALHDELLAHALDMVSSCPCTDGCPSCVGPGGEAGSGGKQETLEILARIVQ